MKQTKFTKADVKYLGTGNEVDDAIIKKRKVISVIKGLIEKIMGYPDDDRLNAMKRVGRTWIINLLSNSIKEIDKK